MSYTVENLEKSMAKITITVEADGTDEEQAVAEIEKYLQNQ